MNDEVIIYNDIMWGNKGEDIVSSPVYQVYRVSGQWLGDDESLYYSYNNLESEISIIDPDDPTKTYTKISVNKYGIPGYSGNLNVKITANSTLSEEFPGALVVIDGKYYDLAYLDNTLTFVMSKDHRITIEWTPEFHEVFRIVKIGGNSSNEQPVILTPSVSLLDSSNNVLDSLEWNDTNRYEFSNVDYESLSSFKLIFPEEESSIDLPEAPPEVFTISGSGKVWTIVFNVKLERNTIISIAYGSKNSLAVLLDYIEI